MNREDRRELDRRVAALQNKADRRLMHLRSWPASADVEARLDRAVRELGVLEAQAAAESARGNLYCDDGRIKRASDDVRYRQDELARSHERDAVQAARPDGCLCLGTGWHPETNRPCPCRDGQVVSAQVDRIAAKLCAERQEERIDAFRDGVPPRLAEFTLDGFPATMPENHSKLIASIRERIERDEMPWLWFSGPCGTGKTGLAKAAAEHVIARGFVDEALFVAVPDLLDRLRSTYDRGSRTHEHNVMDEYRDASLLILDDLGAERATDSGWAADRLFVLINHRYDQELMTIVTSNLTPQQLSNHLGEQGQRIVWRLLEAVGHEVLSLAGMPNLRAPKARAKLEVVSA
jgi:DNA replication protein DnaC